MEFQDCIFVDNTGDVFMAPIFLSLHMIVLMAFGMGYKAVKYTSWLTRHDDLPRVSSVAELPATVDFRSAEQPIRRRSPSPRGSPKRRAQGELAASGGVTKGSKKLRLQRIPRHRFTRSEILGMVKVPEAPVVGLSMQGRCAGSDMPSAMVSFASPEDCNKVYVEVKQPLERDGIWVSVA